MNAGQTPGGGQVASTRPPGLAALAFVFLVSAAVMFYNAATLGVSTGAEALETLGVSIVSLRVTAGFMALLALGSAVGLWRGRPWGWYLAGVWLFYAAARSIDVLLQIDDVVGAAAGVEALVAQVKLKHGARIVVQGFLYLYLTRPRVEAFTGVAGLPRWRRSLHLIGLTLFVLVAVWWVGEIATDEVLGG